MHALFYSGFLEDPITWVVLGVGAGWLAWRWRRPWRRAAWQSGAGGGSAALDRAQLLSNAGAWALLGVLTLMLAVNLPELGSDPWPFRPGAVNPQGPLAPLVRAAGGEWDVGIARSATLLAMLLVAGAGVLVWQRRQVPRKAAVALVVVVGLMLLLPSTLLQMGLRESTEPWFFTNDSTYQIEVAGDLLLHGHNPYGHDYRGSGLERFYTFDGTRSQRVLHREVALDHYAYFPGTVITAAAWRLLPAPFDDYRLFILLCTVASFFAALAFRAPLAWRLALGAVLLANPIAVRSAWFGQNDAPSMLLLVLAFALVTRRRWGWAAASLAGAVLLKQFAIVALPFIAVILIKQGATRPELRRAAAVFAGVVAVGDPALPRLGPRRLLGRHGQVRRGHLQDRGLRAVGDPRADRDHRRPRRRLPVRPVRARPVAPAHGLAARGPVAGARALAGRGGLRDLDPRADVHRPDVQQLLRAVAPDGRHDRGADGGGRDGGRPLSPW